MGKYYSSQAGIDPYDFSTMYKVASELTEAHRQKELQLASLDSAAGSILSNLKPGVDDRAIELINQYRDGLNTMANNLATRGLSQSTNRNALQLSSLYSSSIEPISKLATARQQYKTILSQEQAKNPSLIIASDPDTMQLGEFINGTPQIKMVDGSKYAADVTQLIKSAYQSPDHFMAKLKSFGLKGQDALLTSLGISAEEAVKAINNMSENELVSLAVELAKKMHNTDILTSEDQINRLDGFTNSAILASVDPIKSQIIENDYWKSQEMAYKWAALHAKNQDDDKKPTKTGSGGKEVTDLVSELENQGKQTATGTPQPSLTPTVAKAPKLQTAMDLLIEAAKDPKRRNKTVRQILNHNKAGKYDPKYDGTLFGTSIGDFFGDEFGSSKLKINHMKVKDFIGEYDPVTQTFNYSKYVHAYRQRIAPDLYPLITNSETKSDNNAKALLATFEDSNIGHFTGKHNKKSENAWNEGKTNNSNITHKIGYSDNFLKKAITYNGYTDVMNNLTFQISRDGVTKEAQLMDVYNKISDAHIKAEIRDAMELIYNLLQYTIEPESSEQISELLDIVNDYVASAFVHQGTDKSK